jgi:hypothetical protein
MGEIEPFLLSYEKGDRWGREFFQSSTSGLLMGEAMAKDSLTEQVCPKDHHLEKSKWRFFRLMLVFSGRT